MKVRLKLVCLQLIIHASAKSPVELSTGHFLTGDVDDRYVGVKGGSVYDYLSSQWTDRLHDNSVGELNLYRYEDKTFQNLTVYRGIPYGNATRFQKPIEYSPSWKKGRIFAKEFVKAAPMCMQNDFVFHQYFDITNRTWQNTEMVEDCLTLDIYSPEKASFLPVIFWIHGGGYQSGTSQWREPNFLAATENVVVVVIQYRLGLFGYFSSNSDDAKGNYGHWDQRLALEWTKREIESFGGDHDNIKLMGESAGGTSASAQMIYDAVNSNGFVGEFVENTQV